MSDVLEKPEAEDSRLAEAVEARLSLESRQFSIQAYDRRKTMLSITAAIFAITAGGFKLSQFSAAGFTLKPADELRLLAFGLLLLTYSIGDFWLFSAHEVAGLKAELDRFQSAYGTGTAVIDAMWKRLHAIAVRNPGSGLRNEIKHRMDSSASSHATFLRRHRLRVFWESGVPIGIACITEIIGLLRLLALARSLA